MTLSRIGFGYSSGYYFNGTIDEVRIYNRSLSASEVLDLYNLGSYHLEWDNGGDWSTPAQVIDEIGTISTTGGKFMQFQSFLNSNDTDVSPYLLNHSVGDTPTPPSDFEYPNFNNIGFNKTNGSLYLYGQGYSANATITKTNGTAGIEFNGVNYTASNISSLFTATINELGAGDYNYYWWAFGNGSATLYNISENYIYTIKKATLLDGLLGLGTYEYPWQSNVNITETNNGDDDVTYNLYRDDILVSSPDENSFEAGTYNYIMNSTGGTNYTANASIAEGDLIINKNISYALTLSASPDWTVTQGTQTTITGSGCLTGLTCNLYIDGLLRLNPSIGNLANGTYSFVYNTTGNDNYSALSVNHNLIVLFNFTITTESNVTKDTFIYITNEDSYESPYVLLKYGIHFN
jgi:hypothetical protein